MSVEVEAFLKANGYKRGPWERSMVELVRAANVATGKFRGGIGVDTAVFGTEEFITAKAGASMENVRDMLKSTADEMIEAKMAMQAVADEMGDVGSKLGEKLVGQIKELRASRMAVVSEVRDAISAMKDVRKFFLDDDHEKEIARMERFVSLCREIRALKDDGTFDAVCDSALRLAVK